MNPQRTIIETSKMTVISFLRDLKQMFAHSILFQTQLCDQSQLKYYSGGCEIFLIFKRKK